MRLRNGTKHPSRVTKKTIRTVPEHDVCSNMSSRHEVSYLNTGIRNIYSRLSLSISAPMLNFDPNVRMSGTRYRYPWDELLPVLCTRTSTISSKALYRSFVCCKQYQPFDKYPGFTRITPSRILLSGSGNHCEKKDWLSVLC